jgi:hypothetical protein
VIGLISVVIILVGLFIAGALVYRKHMEQIERIKGKIDDTLADTKDLFSKKA